MKVSRNSWHYRLYRFWYNVWRGFSDAPGPRDYLDAVKHPQRRDPQPKNLCRYFWWCLLNVVFGWLAFLVAWLVIAVVFAVVMPIAWFHDRRQAKRALKQPSPPPQPKEKHPSPFAEFVRARKKKVCPMIELVD